MAIKESVAQSATLRVESQYEQNAESLRHAAAGIPLSAERDFDRLEARLCAKNRFLPAEAGAIVKRIHDIARSEVDRAVDGGPKRVYGALIDLTGGISRVANCDFRMLPSSCLPTG